MKLVSKYGVHVLLSLMLISCLFLSSGCERFERDRGRELVNAAGLSTNEVISLLRSGVYVNERSRSTFGRTALISAIYYHKEEIVDVLLTHGADVNLGDGVNQTPLSWAIEVWPQNTNLIQKLMQHGANPRIKNRYGSNAFDKARAQSNSAQLTEILGIGVTSP